MLIVCYTKFSGGTRAHESTLDLSSVTRDATREQLSLSAEMHLMSAITDWNGGNVDSLCDERDSWHNTEAEPVNFTGVHRALTISISNGPTAVRLRRFVSLSHSNRALEPLRMCQTLRDATLTLVFPHPLNLFLAGRVRFGAPASSLEDAAPIYRRSLVSFASWD